MNQIKPSARRLLIEHRLLPHDCILPRHATTEGALDFGPQSELIHIIGLLGSGLEALALQGFVLEPFQAVAELVDGGQSGVTAREGADGSDGVDGGTAADGGEAFRGAVLWFYID